MNVSTQEIMMIIGKQAIVIEMLENEVAILRERLSEEQETETQDDY